MTFHSAEVKQRVSHPQVWKRCALVAEMRARLTAKQLCTQYMDIQYPGGGGQVLALLW